jgi:formate transporter
MGFHPPAAILPQGTGLGIYKSSLPAWNLLLRGVMAGAYIAMGAALMVMVTTGVESTLGVGMARLFAGAVFPLGVILTTLTGAELFTGDAMLVPMAACAGEVSWLSVTRLWIIVWAGNLIGAFGYAVLMSQSVLITYGSDGVGTVTSAGVATVSMAAVKCGYGSPSGILSLLGSAVVAGWMLNLGVLLALCADDAIGKIMGIWFPVMAMAATGVEHAITNMYLIPAGLLVAGQLTPLQVAAVGPGIADLGWISMWSANLIGATIGNLIGGLFFAGVLYWLAFHRETGN